MDSSRASAGGAAGAGGVDYEACLAAWYSVRILAEDESPSLGLPAGCRFKQIRCQSGEPVDDLLVGTTEDGWLFVQAKRSISLSSGEGSEFAKVIDQFVRQVLAGDVSPSDRLFPWNRPLDRSKDRIVLSCGPGCSSMIKTHLRNVLNRFRESGNALQIESTSRNNNETDALQKTLHHMQRSWQRHRGSEPTHDDLATVLRLIWIDPRDVEADGSDEQNALQLLQHAVVANAADARIAWNSLYSKCSAFAKDRSGGDLAVLRQALTQDRIQLQPSRTYRDDIKRLGDYSDSTLAHLSRFASIETTGGSVHIDRSCVKHLADATSDQSLLVVGAPGAGKSGVLHDLAKFFLNKDANVVVLAVDLLPGIADEKIQSKLGLDHSFVDILANWTGESPAILIIDAFDAARTAQGTRALCALIANLLKRTRRWRLVVSVRSFDLRNSQDLQDNFAGPPAVSGFADGEFGRVRHFRVPRFVKEERDQLRIKAPRPYRSLTRTTQWLTI